jgi:single-stranded-DNA-specific exonuclease
LYWQISPSKNSESKVIMVKNWIIKQQGDEKVLQHLQEVLGVDRPTANLLQQRGIKTFDEAKVFFRPELSHLHDPFLMKDMDRAIERINQAIVSGEKVMVYGDYDVDGTTAVAMVYSYFKDFFPEIIYYIPDRYDEGYGISLKGIDFASANSVRLVIALDCGIKANEKIAYANTKGVDFIICDHHTPGAKIPEAFAVLDAKRSDCNYPFKELSGCGVGFKLIQAFQSSRNLPFEDLIKYLDLVAVSIASDIVPIVGENRVLAFFGLKQINEKPSTGIQTLITLAGIQNKTISIEDIVFKIGPRINAAGRMESGSKSVDLLVSSDTGLAKLMGNKINDFNSTRRNVDSTITQEALTMIQMDESMKNRKSTVLFNPKWHKGVIGIVASRLMDHYYRPTVILTKSNGFATGSARSVNGFDLYQAIEECSELLENFGGHKYAAGLTMKLNNVSAFQERFEKVVSKMIHPDQLIPVVEIDTELQLSDINDKFFRILMQFQPFGPENMAPVFLTENVSDNGSGKPVGMNAEHLKLSLVHEKDPYRVFPGIAFQQGKLFPKISGGQGFDICYSLDENVFRGESTIQINIKDIKVDG